MRRHLRIVLIVAPEATQGDLLVLDIQTTTHSINDRLGLLEDLLLHEVVELALHDLLELELEGLDGADVAAAVRLLQAVDVQRALVNVRDVVVLEVHDLLRVLDDGGRVRGEEELGRHGHAVVRHKGARLGAVEEGLVGGAEKAIGRQEVVPSRLLDGNILGGGLSRQGAVLVGVLNVHEIDLHALLGLNTNDERGALARGDNLVRVVHALDQQAVGALKLVDDGLGEVGEADAGVES